MTTEPFVDYITGDVRCYNFRSIEVKGSPFKAHAHLTTETHTCTSNLKLSDDNVVVKWLKKICSRMNYQIKHPLCLRKQILI
jgi:hypothetical protein